MNKKCLDAFLTVADAAIIYKSTREGILKAIREKRLRAVWKGRQWLIHSSDFARFMNGRAGNG